MANEVPPERMIVIDEFHNYMGDDSLREKLRAIDGVPGVSYLVQGEKVFVFEKLVQLVKQNNHNLSLASELVPQATVTALEAIEDWSVFPEPYERYSDDHGQSLSIYHRYFNAYIPRKYQSRDECNIDAARLLLGHQIDGEGDFSYRGQQMVLKKPFTLNGLPERAEWLHKSHDDIYAYSHLWNTNFVSGFAPISESLFNDIKSIEVEWKKDTAATFSFVSDQDNTAALWARAGELGLDAIVGISECSGEEDPALHADFQALYPELSMLPPAVIQEAFDDFLEGMWELPYRDEAFLFYLMGRAASAPDCTVQRLKKGTEAAISQLITSDCDFNPVNTGKLIAYSLLMGNSVADAYHAGLEAKDFDNAISTLAYEVSLVMKYLARDVTAKGIEGNPVSTLGDSFRLMRKSGVSPLTIKQTRNGFLS
ncbi:hypothetical protein IHW74_004237 [Salmonella enterica]|nr:hypothetical protein [Salmonella enterica]